MCACVCVRVCVTARHATKCIAERRKPVSEQADAVQRESCERCFRSRGLAVHRCRRPEESPDSAGGTAAAAPQGQVVCTECGRTLPQMV